MTEKRIMRLKRGLKKRARKLRLGAKRTGAYVYGTLRRIMGNRGLTPRQQKMLDFLKRVYPQYSELARDSATKKDASRLARLKLIKVRSFKRTGTSRGKRFSMIIMEARAMAPKGGQLSSPVLGLARNPYVSKILGDMKSQQLKYRGFTIILERQPNTILATWTDGDTLQSQRYSGYSFREVYEVVKDEIDDLIKPSRPGMLRGNPIRSSFDKPTFGPFNTETRRVNTTTMAGMREAEKLRRAGWYQGPVTLFSTTYYRQRALPKSSMARQIRGNPAISAHRGNPKFMRSLKVAEMRSKDLGVPFGVYAYEGMDGLTFIASEPGRWPEQYGELVTLITPKGARGLRRNPPMYAHRMMSHRTHGLSLKQMMKLYRLVSSGNPKAVMYARRTLGIPMSESLSQVKAVVYHHILDLKGKI